MNRKVFKVYMLFYVSVVCLIVFGTMIYALINRLDIPYLLIVIDVFMALALCAIISLLSARFTRIIEMQIESNEIEGFKQYLLNKQFVERTEGEYYWNRTPSFLFRSVEVRIEDKNEKYIKVLIPYSIKNWKK